MSWNDERVEMLKKLWAEGLSATEIGKRMNTSKNAIIGKAHRMGLPSRPSPIRTKDRAKPKKSTPKKTAQPVVEPVKSQPEPKPEPKPAKEPAQEHSPVLTTKRGQCAWPFSDPDKPDFRFCGKPALCGKPYCQEHYDIAYIQPRLKDGSSRQGLWR